MLPEGCSTWQGVVVCYSGAVVLTLFIAASRPVVDQSSTASAAVLMAASIRSRSALLNRPRT